jgi:Spy/CpxP family protein refolding chaperone
MKVTKPMIIAALVAGNLLAWNLTLRAADTNTPPAGAPPAGQRPPMMRGGPNVDQLAKMLDLTDDQKAKVKPIFEARDKKIADLRGDTNLSQEDRRTKMQSIREETTAQMKAILTPEQFDKYLKMTQRGPRPGGPRPGGEKAGGPDAPAAPPKN